MSTFNEHLHLPVVLVDHSKQMLARLAGVSDPEAKRKAIGAEFIEVFKAYATELEKKLGKKPKFLVQVRLAAGSRIERCYVWNWCARASVFC